MEIERTKAYLEEILPGMGYVLDSVTFTKEAGTHYLGHSFLEKMSRT